LKITLGGMSQISPDAPNPVEEVFRYFFNFKVHCKFEKLNKNNNIKNKQFF